MISRRRLLQFGRLAVSIAALAYLLHKAGIGPILHHLEKANGSWLTIGFAFGGLSALWTVTQWHALVNLLGLRRTYGRCLRLELAGDVFDAALPSSVGGDLIRATVVADERSERVRGAASVLLRRLCNFPGMVAVMAIGMLASAGLSYSGRIAPYAGVAIFAGACASITTFSPLLGWLGQAKWLSRGPGRPVAKVLAAMDELRGQRVQLFFACGRGFIFWCLVVISQWCFMRALGIHVPFVYAAAVVTTTNALTMLPISLGGYGLREGAFSAFLAVGGLATTAQGVAVGVCLTAQTMALGLIGIPFYLTTSRARRARMANTNEIVDITSDSSGDQKPEVAGALS